ncbi:MAG: hypothetical protein IJP66_01770 [Kiritimatiellae bacterium]|nr:hypothetical protein [Kiritimatiellia bacterium]
MKTSLRKTTGATAGLAGAFTALALAALTPRTSVADSPFTWTTDGTTAASM